MMMMMMTGLKHVPQCLLVVCTLDMFASETEPKKCLWCAKVAGYNILGHPRVCEGGEPGSCMVLLAE
jgi:hypothetical protein